MNLKKIDIPRAQTTPDVSFELFCSSPPALTLLKPFVTLDKPSKHKYNLDKTIST
jgi:hypothetical protein